MQEPAVERHARVTHAVFTILLAGAVAGGIDLASNTIRALSAGTPVLRPWMGVAAALLGKEAIIRGGQGMAFVGLALHFLITIGAATCYCVAATRVAWLTKHSLASGIVFGTLFFIVMNYVILPLSVMGRPLYVGEKTIAYALVMHILMIGLPISLITAWRVLGFAPVLGRRRQ
jgi:hypothetical protein